MKTRACFLLVLSGLAITSAFAAPPAKQAFSHPVGSVERSGNTLFTRGPSEMEVEKSLGAPHSKLSANVWTYKNFHGGTAQRPDDDCSTLLVAFTHGWVSGIKLVNDRAVQFFAARLNANASDKVQVAAK